MNHGKFFPNAKKGKIPEKKELFGQPLEEMEVVFVRKFICSCSYNPKTRQMSVPQIVLNLTRCIENKGLDEEGIFRISGQLNKLENLSEMLSAGVNCNINDFDVHTVASTLKKFLRDLPSPLIQFDMYESIMTTVNTTMVVNADEALESLHTTLHKIPTNHFNLLNFLCAFLFHVSLHSASNKMNIENLSTIFVNAIIRPESDTPEELIDTIVQRSAVCAVLIKHQEKLFDKQFKKKPELKPAGKKVYVALDLLGFDSKMFPLLIKKDVNNIMEFEDALTKANFRHKRRVFPDNRPNEPPKHPLFNKNPLRENLPLDKNKQENKADKDNLIGEVVAEIAKNVRLIEPQTPIPLENKNNLKSPPLDPILLKAQVPWMALNNNCEPENDAKKKEPPTPVPRLNKLKNPLLDADMKNKNIPEYVKYVVPLPQEKERNLKNVLQQNNVKHVEKPKVEVINPMNPIYMDASLIEPHTPRNLGNITNMFAQKCSAKKKPAIEPLKFNHIKDYLINVNMTPVVQDVKWIQPPLKGNKKEVNNDYNFGNDKENIERSPDLATLLERFKILKPEDVNGMSDVDAKFLLKVILGQREH